ncbi:MAG TPA: 3-deoxy-7-phosphoheptulonate synthase [Negativicutes bacterium]|nr:3-deoxy-7-phosphoheptulonate synthase [Negativicutes bacterium]
MIIVMTPQATEEQKQIIIDRIQGAGLRTHVSEGDFRTIIGIIGDRKAIMAIPWDVFAGVEKTVPITSSLKLVSREFRPSSLVVDVGGVKIGDGSLTVMAGPCAVESKAQLQQAAEIVKASGGKFLRGGAFKPRTSPYAFQGLARTGLEYLAEMRELTGLKIVTEVMDTETVGLVADYADMLQIGARNMQNFPLLKSVGRAGKPVLLKRGLSATIDEWLHAAEYILNEGNFNVVLCERGIRTFEAYTRNTLDLSAVAAVKQLSHLPVIVDPSHATGRWRLAGPMAMAAVAAGADGVMLEMHPNPAEALCDGPQSLNPAHFSALMKELAGLAAFLHRR